MRPILLALLFTACGSSNETLTRGEVCVEMAAAVCAERFDCGAISNVAACRDAEETRCCTAGCEIDTDVTDDAMDTCITQISEETPCGGDLPASCPTFD